MALPDIVCGSCGATYRHPGRAGATKCKKCATPITVTLPTAAAAPEAPRPAVARPVAAPSRPSSGAAPSSAPRPAAAPRPASPEPRPPEQGTVRPSAPVRSAAPAASRGIVRKSAKAQDETEKPIKAKPKGMSPALLWGSVGIVVLAGVGLFLTTNAAKKRRAERAAEEKAALALADKPAKSEAPVVKHDDAPGYGGPDSPAATPKTDEPTAKTDPKPANAGEPPVPADPDAKPVKKRAAIKELKPFEMVAGFSDAQKTAIEGDLAVWMNPTAGVEGNRALDRLSKLGKPVIPVLLNKFIMLDLKDESALDDATALNQALRELTGQTYHFTRETGEDAEYDREVTRVHWSNWWTKNKEKFTGRSMGEDE